MDFLERQAHARKQSRRLVWLFSLALLAALVVNNLVLCSLVACFTHPVLRIGASWHPVNLIITFIYLLGEAAVHPGHFIQLIVNWPLVVGISLGTILSIAAGSYFKIRELSDGGPVVAEFLGGRRLAVAAADLDEQRLRDVVEEMAIASGTPVPEIYVLDCERGLNAFAAGHTRDDVAIGVTRGCVKLLTRDELQGVIAHEFSHILNGDTAFNMKLIGLAHGLFWPTLLGRVLIYGRTEPPPGASVLVAKDKVQLLPTAPLGWVFVFLGSFSLPFVRLLKSAICRQREWLADAAAVQFTRNPEGIVGALKKIGGLFKHGRLDTAHAEVASHLYFANSDYEPWFAFLGTHPPVAKRVSAIDPRFNGEFPKINMLAPNQAEYELACARVLSETLALKGGSSETASAADPLGAEQVRQVAVFRFALPAEIKSALRTSTGAANIIYSLLLSGEDSVRARQTGILAANLAPPVFEHFQVLLPLIQSLDDKYKLPLAELATPALKENDDAGNSSLHKIMRQLVECDDSMDLFEYTLMKMITRRLRPCFERPAAAQPKYGRVSDLLPECALLLSALAHVGSDDEAVAREAIAAGVEFLDLRGASVPFLTRSEWDLARVDAALTRLAGYHEPLRRNILLACGKTVAADGRVSNREAELLRAVADSLDCPMPPFVEAIWSEELSKTT